MVHLEPVGLRLVRPDHRQQSVLVQEVLGQLVPEVVRTPSGVVVLGQSVQLAGVVVHGVGPHQVAEQP